MIDELGESVLVDVSAGVPLRVKKTTGVRQPLLGDSGMERDECADQAFLTAGSTGGESPAVVSPTRPSSGPFRIAFPSRPADPPSFDDPSWICVYRRRDPCHRGSCEYPFEARAEWIRTRPTFHTAPTV